LIRTHEQSKKHKEKVEALIEESKREREKRKPKIQSPVKVVSDVVYPKEASHPMEVTPEDQLPTSNHVLNRFEVNPNTGLGYATVEAISKPASLSSAPSNTKKVPIKFSFIKKS
jgi:hypothetical protein